MYWEGNVQDFFGTCSAIVGAREAGKTTILKKILAEAKKQDYTILLFDSATDHELKSLLVHAKEKYENTLTISSPEKEEILFNSVSTHMYPYDIVLKSTSRMYLFDVSRYLEEGYDTDDLEERQHIREYYKRLVLQELKVMFPLLYKKKCIILMDEIELIDDMNEILNSYVQEGASIVIALHSQDSLAECKNIFKVVNLS